MFYSKKTNGFYTTEIHGDKMPPDVVKISPKEHEKLFAGQRDGRIIKSDDRGFPVLVDRPAKTQKEIDDENNRLIFTALEEIDRKSIRALRVGDSSRLVDLESQAVELRKKLK